MAFNDEDPSQRSAEGLHPFQGNLGWLAGDPAHAGRGLGAAVSAAATTRLIAAGHRDIRLGTEDFRLAAIRIYLKLGYVYLNKADNANAIAKFEKFLTIEPEGERAALVKNILNAIKK